MVVVSGIRVLDGISVRPLQLDNSTNKILVCVGITHEHIAASEQCSKPRSFHEILVG